MIQHNSVTYSNVLLRVVYFTCIYTCILVFASSESVLEIISCSNPNPIARSSQDPRLVATMVTDSKDDWSIPCMANENEELEPPPEELESMYQLLESGGMLELQWKCAGRRQPSPVAGSSESNAEVTPEKDT